MRGDVSVRWRGGAKRETALIRNCSGGKTMKRKFRGCFKTIIVRVIINPPVFRFGAHIKCRGGSRGIRRIFKLLFKRDPVVLGFIGTVHAIADKTLSFFILNVRILDDFAQTVRRAAQNSSQPSSPFVNGRFLDLFRE